MCVCTCKPLAYDEFSGRYIRASHTDLQLAEAVFQNRLLAEGSGSLNEFYDLILLDPLAAGEELGWGEVNSFALKFGLTTAPNGDPATSFGFKNAPSASSDWVR